MYLMASARMDGGAMRRAASHAVPQLLVLVACLSACGGTPRFLAGGGGGSSVRGAFWHDVDARAPQGAAGTRYGYVAIGNIDSAELRTCARDPGSNNPNCVAYRALCDAWLGNYAPDPAINPRSTLFLWPTSRPRTSRPTDCSSMIESLSRALTTSLVASCRSRDGLRLDQRPGPFLLAAPGAFDRDQPDALPCRSWVVLDLSGRRREEVHHAMIRWRDVLSTTTEVLGSNVEAVATELQINLRSALADLGDLVFRPFS